jgi:hypothetical protein
MARALPTIAHRQSRRVANVGWGCVTDRRPARPCRQGRPRVNKQYGHIAGSASPCDDETHGEFRPNCA